jgi:hypothetical protein
MPATRCAHRGACLNSAYVEIFSPSRVRAESTLQQQGTGPCKHSGTRQAPTKKPARGWLCVLHLGH